MQLIYSASDGPISGRGMFRYENDGRSSVVTGVTTTGTDTDASGDIDTVSSTASKGAVIAIGTYRMEVSWAISDTMKLTVAPSYFGFAGLGTNSNADYFRFNAAGANAVDNMIPEYSVQVIALDMNLGGLNLGFGIVGLCADANYTAGGTSGGLCQQGASGLKTDDQTIVVHVKGSAGSIAYNGGFGTGSGTDIASDESVAGTALQAGLTFDGGGWKVGFDYGSKTLAGIGDGDDIVNSFIGLAFFLGSSLGVDYHSRSVDNGTDTATDVDLDAHWKMLVGEKSYIGVEFRNNTTNSGAEGASDATRQFIGFGARVNY
jgi:hypothetical protein